MKKSLCAAAALSCFVLFAQEKKAETAQDEISEKKQQQESAKIVNGDIQASQPISSSMTMDEEFESFRKERGIKSYGIPNERGILYFTGKAAVPANVNSADFIKSRAIAYEKAYQDAVAGQIMDMVGIEMIKSVIEDSSNESTDKYELPQKTKGKWSVFQDKLSALTEAKLDKALAEMGIDPAQYQGKNVVEKKNVYTDSLIKKSFRKAMHQSSGFMPVQTFETRNAEGVYTIGVVIRMDADCSEIARCISKKQRPAITRPDGVPVTEVLPTDEELITQFGIRIVFTEKGEPALLSFGQFGSSYTGRDAKQAERAMKSAFIQAQSLADQQLTAFINSSISVQNVSEIGEKETEDVLRMDDDSQAVENMRKIIDRYSNKSQMTGMDSMIGRSTIVRKTLEHPSGHKIASVVRLWSFDQLDAMKGMLNIQQNGKRQSDNGSKKEGSGARRGRAYDF